MKNLMARELAGSVVDALTSNICVVDLAGRILGVNRAWVEFSSGNSGGAAKKYRGTNYLSVCKASSGDASAEASDFSNGLQDVFQGRKELYQIEYPCHSPTSLRWFLARVTPLYRGAKGKVERIGAVVSHMDISDRKLLELQYAKLASTDPLTDLPNRRFFEEYAKLEIERLRRFGGPMSLLMIDLDKFKNINDSYGHIAGDEVLKMFASHGKSMFRAADPFARIGGEEFVALLVGTDEAGALLVAERLRSSVAAVRIPTCAGSIRVTASVGLTTVTMRDRSVTSPLRRADKALYRAKEGGRNRIEVAL